MADTDYLAASDGTGDAALMHITTPRTALATIIQVDTVAGVPAFFVGTWGTLLASGFIDPTTKRDFFGHVNAGTLVIDKMAPGNTDNGNTSGQVVVIKPSTPVQNLVGNFVKTALNNFGEGQLLNGQIVPSVNSNNLTVAIKTLAGVDPSTTDVVYVRIGNAVRSITAPLSVVLAAGTNWFGRGSGPSVSQAANLYVFIGYNSTDGVVLGVSATSRALIYSDFSTTSTNWNYAKISNIAHAAATDAYENVGRFNAILGPTATFNWSLPVAGAQLNTSQPSAAIGALWSTSGLMSPATALTTAYQDLATVTLPTTNTAHKYLIVAAFTFNGAGVTTAYDITAAIRQGNTVIVGQIHSTASGVANYFRPLNATTIYTASAAGGDIIQFSAVINANGTGVVNNGNSHYTVVDLGPA